MGTVTPNPTVSQTMAPSPTFPPPDIWTTYQDPLGAFQLRLPPIWDAWAVPLECGVLHFFDSGAVYSLRLLVFTRCWETEDRQRLLSFDETYARFTDQFEAISRTTAGSGGIEAERIRYRAVEGDFLLDLKGFGTLALWRRGELGFAFIDHRDRWQADQVFDRILRSFERTPGGQP
jgi:hypothetical protein